MSDRIDSCAKELNEDSSVRQWSFSYTVESGDTPPRLNNFCVTVLASEMTTPTDEAEAKTKANTKASAIKTAWLAQDVTTTAEVAAVVGDVTL